MAGAVPCARKTVPGRYGRKRIDLEFATDGRARGVKSAALLHANNQKVYKSDLCTP
jgi:hypothetical protein